MAKNKKLKVEGAVNKWDGTAFSFIGTILLAILALAVAVAIPVVAGFVLGVFKVGGDKLMLLIVLIATVLSFVIGIDWVIVIFMKWNARHTIINGQRMKLKVNPITLFLNTLKWVVLTVITCGLYIFWLPGAIKNWKLKNTDLYAEEKEKAPVEEVDASQPQIIYYTVEDDEDDE